MKLTSASVTPGEWQYPGDVSFTLEVDNQEEADVANDPSFQQFVCEKIIELYKADLDKHFGKGSFTNPDKPSWDGYQCN